MRVLLMLSLALTACDDGSTSVMVDDAVPLPPVQLQVSTTDFVLGGTAEITVSGATPFTLIYLAYSPNGPGDTICPASWGGACAGLAAPVTPIRTALTDNTGTAVFSLDLPLSLPFDEAWLQAAIPGDPAFLTDAFVVDILPADPLERGWDGTGARPPGPHAHERGLVSAWRFNEPTFDVDLETTFSSVCDPTEPGWAQLFEPPDFDTSLWNYAFYQVSSTDETATHKTCGNQYPTGCDDTEASGQTPVLMEIDDHNLSFSFDPFIEQVRGCSISAAVTWEFVDGGMEGEFNIYVDFAVVGACASTVNNGCTVTHSMAVDWIDARSPNPPPPTP